MISGTIVFVILIFSEKTFKIMLKFAESLIKV